MGGKRGNTVLTLASNVEKGGGVCKSVSKIGRNPEKERLVGSTGECGLSDAGAKRYWYSSDSRSCVTQGAKKKRCQRRLTGGDS